MNIAKKFNQIATALMLYIAPMRDVPATPDNVSDERKKLVIDPPKPVTPAGVKI